MGKSRISVWLGPVRTAARTFSNWCSCARDSMMTLVEKVTIPALHQMKRDGRKIVGVVAWDYQIAQIADRAGVEIVSVGDSVGMNLWGQPTETEVTLEELLVVCKAVRRGVKRALVSCDIPFGPVHEGK